MKAKGAKGVFGLVVAAGLLLAGQGAFAQAANYAAVASTGASLQTVPGSATQILNTSNDDTPSPYTSLGTGNTFTFNGTTYSTFSVSPDGWLSFSNATSGSASAQYSNAINSGTNVPKFSPYWDDCATGTTGYAKYWFTGSGSSAMLNVEWFLTIPRSTAGAANGRFQATFALNVAAPQVTYTYGAINAGSSYSCGISGSATDYLSILTATDVTSTTVASNSQTNAIASGKKYTLTPATCPAGVLTVTAPAYPNSTDMTLTQSGSTPALGYQYRYAVTSVGTYTAPTAFATSPVTVSGLTKSTAYTFQVRKICAVGDTSVWAIGTGTTNNSCNTPGIGTITPAAYPNGSQASVAYSVVSNGSLGYQYRLKVTSATNFGSPVAVSASPIALSGLTKSTNYTIQMRSICAVGDTSAWTAGTTFTTNATCNAPTSVTVASITATTATVSVSGLPTNGSLGLQYQLFNGALTAPPVAGTWTSLSYTGTTASIPLTGLGYSSYKVAVRTICAVGDTSSNTLSSSFTTTAPTATGFGAGYNVTQSNITYSSIAATGNTPLWNSTSTDDNYTKAMPIGFNFSYDGVTYSNIIGSTNGWATFNLANTSTSYSNNLLTSSLTGGMLAPFWEDLVAQGNTGTAITLNAALKYQTIGSAPNRQFILEWVGMERYGQASPDLNFQIVLNETSNTIEYRYGNMVTTTGQSNINYSYSVGMTSSLYANSAANRVASKFFAQVQADTLKFSTATANDVMKLAQSCNVAYVFTPNTAYTGISTVYSNVVSNDEPATAILLPVPTSPPSSSADFCGTRYRSAGATASAGYPVCAGGTQANADDDVWFQFVANSSNTNVRVIGGENYNPVFQIYDANLNSIACNTAPGAGLLSTIALTGATATTPLATYYVRVYHNGTSWGTAGVSDPGYFFISPFAVPAPPSNDDPAGAYAVTVGSSSLTATPVNGLSYIATQSNYPACTGTPDDDVWYRFVANNTSDSIVVTAGAGFNPAVEIMDASFTSVACVNTYGIGLNEVINATGLATSQTYYVRVYHAAGGWGTGAGLHTVSVFGAPAPGTDLAAYKLLTPNTATCPQASQAVSATILNAGLNALNFASNNATITMTVNIPGSSPVIFTQTLTSGTLASGASRTINFGNITMTAAGSYSYSLNVSMTGDLLATNDNASYSRTIVATQATPYAVDFDAAAGVLPTGWTNISGWYNSTPYGYGNNGYALYAYQYANYNYSATTPVFTNVQSNSRLSYAVQLSDYAGTIPYTMQAGDSLNVMISSNCGSSFSILKSYNATTLATNNTLGYRFDTISLAPYVGQSIQIKLVAKAGPSSTGGWYDRIDNFAIDTPLANDLQGLAFTSPSATGCYNGTQNVIVTVKNAGSNAWDFSTNNATINVTVAGAFSGTLSLPLTSGTLNAGATGTYTVGTLSMATAGTYTFTGSLTAAADQKTSNNSFATATRTVIDAFATPYSQNFDASTATPTGWALNTWYTNTTYGNNATTAIYNYNYSTNTTVPTARTPVITNLPANSYIAYAYKVSDYAGTTPYTMVAGDSLNLYISTNCGASYTRLRSITSSNYVAANGFVYVNDTVQLGAYTGQNVLFQWRTKTVSSGIYFRLDDIAIEPYLANDLAAQIFTTPAASGCYGATENVTVRVKNVGQNAWNFSTNNVALSAAITGTVTNTLTSNITSGTLAPGATATYVLGSLNMTTAGTYTFNGTLTSAADQKAGNNSFATATRTVLPTFATPYSQDFDASTATPTGWALTTWYTNTTYGNGGTTAIYNYNYSGNTSVNSARTPIFGPVLANGYIAYSYKVSDYAGTTQYAMTTGDSLNLYVSTDCGNSFSLLRAITSSNYVQATASAYRNDTVSLSAYTGQNVVFQWKTKTVSTGQYFRVDDIAVENYLSNDLDGLAFTTPATAGCYGASEPVTVTIKNTGVTAWDFATNNATLNITVGGVAPQTLSTTLSSGTLAAGATGTYVVGNLNMSTSGTYTFNGTIVAAADQKASNNSFTYTTRNVLYTFPMPYSQSFDFNTNLPLGWSANGGFSTGWTVTAGAGANGSNNGIKVDVYSTGTSALATLNQPVISGINAQTYLSYAYKALNYASTTPHPFIAGDSLNIYISTDCGTTFSLIKSYNVSTFNNTVNAYLNDTIQLGAYAGQNVFIKYVARSQSPSDFDNYLDQIAVEQPIMLDLTANAIVSPAATGCYTANTRVEATFTNTGLQTWDFSTDPVTVNGTVSGSFPTTFTTTLNTGTLARNATATYTVGYVNMTQAGTYVFNGTISATNDGRNNNNVFGNLSRTVQPSFTYPYSQNFNGTTNLPTAWSGSNAYILAGSGDNGSNGLYMYTYSGSTNNYFQTGRITNVPANSNVLFQYHPSTSYGAGGSYTFAAGDTVKVLVSTDCGVSFTELGRLNSSNATTGGTGFELAYFPLTAYAGQDIVVRVSQKSASTGFYSYFDNFGINTVNTTDVGVSAVTVNTGNACQPSGASVVTATITNYGVARLSSGTTIPVRYAINGGAPVNATLTLTANLNPLQTVNYTFTQTANLSATGSYNVFAKTLKVPDADATNNGTTTIVVSNPVISSFPYYQSFESSNNGWTAGGTNSSWVLGTPAHTGSTLANIVGASAGTKAWVTSLSGTYNNSEASYVASPCMDFTSLTAAPYVTFKIWWLSESSWDGASLQYSTNNGGTWNNVGTVQSGWYNSNTFSSTTVSGFVGTNGYFNGASTGTVGTVGVSSQGYVSRQIQLPAAVIGQVVRLRIAFASDPSVIPTGGGVAFDEFAVVPNAPAGTSLRAYDCGYTHFTLATGRNYVLANPVSGATFLEYTFQRTLGGVNQGTAVVVNTANNSSLMRLGTGSGAGYAGLLYGSTYNVTVRANARGIYGLPGTACQIVTIPNPTPITVPTTQLRTFDCNRQNIGLVGDYVAADLVNFAAAYEFRFTNTATNVVSSVIQASRFVNLSSLSPALSYGATYSVQVRGIIDNTPGNFGTTCTITTTPLTVLNPTSLRPNECGGTRALSGYVGAIIVAGIDGYVFNIYSDTIVPTLVASVSQASPYLTLSSVTPALSAGTTYFVRVQTRLDGNVSANNGSICPLIIAPATPRGMAGIAGGFNAAAYPNPFTTEVTLLTQNAAGYEVVDMAGRTVLSRRTITAERTVFGTELQAGAYQVRVYGTDGSVQTLSVVKGN